MYDLNNKLVSVQNALFKEDKATVKSHTLRLNLDLTAKLDALTEYCDKPKNTVAAEILDLGMSYFINSLESKDKAELARLYDEHKDDLIRQATHGDNY
mgnify:CR=1 FL=1|jgi:hypothetical protein